MVVSKSVADKLYDNMGSKTYSEVRANMISDGNILGLNGGESITYTADSPGGMVGGNDTLECKGCGAPIEGHMCQYCGGSKFDRSIDSYKDAIANMGYIINGM